MTCPHEQLRWRCYHPSLAPWPGNCLDDDTCPGGFGPWGAWRSVIDKVRDHEARYFRMLSEDWGHEECIKDEELFYVSCDAQYLVQAAGCNVVWWTVV